MAKARFLTVLLWEQSALGGVGGDDDFVGAGAFEFAVGLAIGFDAAGEAASFGLASKEINRMEPMPPNQESAVFV